MKRVLITGSAGFVGHHTVDYILKKTDWQVIGVDSLRHRGDSMRVTADPNRFTHMTHDLTAPFSDRQKLKMGPIDYVINIASMSHVDTSISDPTPFFESNCKLAANVLSLAKEKSVKAFIQCGTDEQFGAAPDGYAHHEWDVVMPSNPYAASKVAQEALTISYWRTFDLPIILTRCMNMIGTRQDPEKFVPMLVRRIHLGETVKIHGQPGRVGSRMYLDCKNLADAWLFLLQNHEPNRYSDDKGDHQRPSAFNIAGLEEIDNLELAKRVSDLMGKPLHYEFEDFHKTRPGHDRRYALDCSKIISHGWKPPIPLDETLREIISYTLAHPEWLT